MSTVDIEAQLAPAETDDYDAGVKWTDDSKKQHIDGDGGGWSKLKRTRSRIAEKPHIGLVRQDTIQPEDAREKQVRGSALDSSTSWARCAEELWKHEKDIIQDLKEGIDTLLLFAGLFSAVVTAFNVEFYKTLQHQPADSTAQILMHISAQLSSFDVSSSSVNSTIPGYPARYPEPVSRLDVATNTLWFSALVISLAAASIGITIKQWLNNHVAGVPSNPRQSATAWYLRHTGFHQWHVEDIANLMPVLLQLSLMLFLVGLVLQFWKTNGVVAGVVLGETVILMAFAFGTAITPSLSSHSPYKSPMSRFLYRLFRVWRGGFGMGMRKVKRACAKLRARMTSTFVRQYTADFKAIENLPSWEDREDFELTSLVPNIEPVVVLDAALKTLRGDFLDRVLQPFLRFAPSEIALPIFEHYCNKEDMSFTLTIGYMAVDILSNIHSREASMFDRSRPASRSGKFFPTPLSSDRARIMKLLQSQLSNMPSGEYSLYNRLTAYYKRLNVSSEHRLQLLQLLTNNVKAFRNGEELINECSSLGGTAIEMLSDVVKPRSSGGSDPDSVLPDILDCLKRLLRLTPPNEPSVYLGLIELIGSVDLPMDEAAPDSFKPMVECVHTFSTLFMTRCEGVPTLLLLYARLSARRRVDESVLLTTAASIILWHLWRSPYSDLLRVKQAVLDIVTIDSIPTQKKPPLGPDAGSHEYNSSSTAVGHHVPANPYTIVDRYSGSRGTGSAVTLDTIIYAIHRLISLPESVASQVNRDTEPKVWALECARASL